MRAHANLAGPMVDDRSLDLDITVQIHADCAALRVTEGEPNIFMRAGQPKPTT